MRTLTIADGRGTVRVTGHRATVRVDGQFVGQVVKVGGRWIGPTGETYDGPATAAEDLADTDLQAA
jgi:hypothetical protein